MNVTHSGASHQLNDRETASCGQPLGSCLAPHEDAAISLWFEVFGLFFNLFMIKNQTQRVSLGIMQLSLWSCADFRLRDFCSQPSFKSNQGLKKCLGC